jgi:tight adherence protein B
MNTVNLLTVCAFIGVVLLGVMGLTLQDLRKQRPDARIKTRLEQEFLAHGVLTRDARHYDTDLFMVSKSDTALSRWFGPRIARLKTVAGASGLRIVIGVVLVAEIVACVMAYFMPLPGATKPLLLVGLPVFAVERAYTFLVARFRQRFLDGFPELLDLIVRAVRAGVPVTHVISTAAKECPEPLATEFKLMGDSLQMGLDLEEVFAVAVKRIEVADFSFFCVCLLLQRETGGQLGETLENLAGIVRTRREIRQKTKALTGEARITTKILAAIPFVIVLCMYGMNRAYVMVLFNTPTGQRLLSIAAVLLVFGVAVINNMSKMDTSR